MPRFPSINIGSGGGSGAGGSGATAIWGGITGSLDAQADLKAALDAKAGAGAEQTAIWGHITGTLANQSDLLALLGAGGTGVETLSYQFGCDDALSGVMAGQKQDYIRTTGDFTVVGCLATVAGPSTSGPVVIDVNINGLSVFNDQKLQIDAGEKSSRTASALPEALHINAPTDAEISVDVDSAGVGATGWRVTVFGIRSSLGTAPAAPVSIGLAPSFSGVAAVGNLLTVTSNGTWSNGPTGFTYEWLLDGTVVDWTSGNTFTIRPEFAGRALSMRVTASNGGGYGQATSDPVAVAGTKIQWVPPLRPGISQRLLNVNHTPSVVADASTVNDTSSFIIGNLLFNDSDADGNSLTITGITFASVSRTVGEAFNTPHGSMTIGANGVFTYTLGSGARALQNGQVATESFGYTAHDGLGGLSSSQLLITIHGTDQAPIAVADDGYSLIDHAASGNVLVNDGDPEGVSLAVTQYTVFGVAGVFAPGDTATIPSVGTFTMEADGEYEYAPVTGYSGILPSITYTVSDGSLTSTGVLTLVVQPAPLPRVSNPVTSAMVGVRTFNVGPGQTHETPDTVPWAELAAGDVVNIYYRPAPYVTKIAMRCRGSFAYPVVINGVTDASGNRPVIDGNNAVTPPTVNQGPTPVFSSPPVEGTESVGVIIIRRGGAETDPNYRPGHIHLKNLAITGAAPGNTFTTLTGGSGAYSFSAGIYGRTATHVLVENCLVYDNILGVFTHVNGSGPMNRCENWTFRSSRFYDNGAVGSNTEHGFYIQGINFTVEYCFIGQLRAGAGGSSFKSRVGGDIFRYNWVEANARAMDFVEMEDQDPWDLSDPLAAINQPNHGIDYCYGNVIINDWTLPNGSSYRPIHYGADNLGEQTGPGSALLPSPPHRKKLYFFNNTFLSNVSNGGARNFIFQISLRDIVVECWNNIFYLVGNVELAWTQHAGTINFRGTNLVYRSGGGLVNAQYDATAANVRINELGTKITSDPQFLSPAAGSRDLSLSETSPALNIGTAAPAGLPAGFDDDWPVQFMPRVRANGCVARATIGAGMDLGAYEFDPSAPPTSAPVNLVAPNLSPDAAAIGDTLSTTNGTWLHMSAGSYAYQWQRNISGTWTNISGATANSYVAENAGDHRVRVRATNAVNFTDAYSDFGVVSSVAIVAPTIGGVASLQSESRNVGGFGVGAGFNTQTSTNLLLFITDFDGTLSMTAGDIYDNAGNNGHWSLLGTVDLTGGLHTRRVHCFGRVGASGRSGHTITIYPAGENAYPSIFAIEVPGSVAFDSPVLMNDASSPYESDDVVLSGDSLLVACAATKFTTGGSFAWGGGFTPVAGAEITNLGADDRGNGSVASRIATTGTYKASLTIPTGTPDGTVGVIVVPVRFA